MCTYCIDQSNLIEYLCVTLEGFTWTIYVFRLSHYGLRGQIPENQTELTFIIVEGRKLNTPRVL